MSALFKQTNGLLLDHLPVGDFDTIFIQLMKLFIHFRILGSESTYSRKVVKRTLLPKLLLILPDEYHVCVEVLCHVLAKYIVHRYAILYKEGNVGLKLRKLLIINAQKGHWQFSIRESNFKSIK